MRVCILSCSTGGGHNAVSSALQECFLRHGDVCDVVDAYSFFSPAASDFLGKAHARIYRHIPRAFSRGYRMAEEHPRAFRPGSVLWRVLTAGSDKLYEHLVENEYDTVICAHSFITLIMTAVRERYPSLRVLSCFVATDYTCSPPTGESDLDLYVIPDDCLAEEFVRCGLPRERLHGAGIPVREAFARVGSRESAKEQLGITPTDKHLVMMGGSMGCGPMEKMVRIFCDTLPAGVSVSVVCGTNTALQKKLERKYGDHPSLHILGYVQDVAALMDSADLYLTKPGGISVTEAATKGLPMVLIDAVAGCEAYNLRYFTERGMACTAQTPEALARKCLSLLTTESDALERMAAQMTARDFANAAERIRALLCSACPTLEGREEVIGCCVS